MKIASRFSRAEPCKPDRALVKMYSHLQKAKMRLAFCQTSRVKKAGKPSANDYIYCKRTFSIYRQFLLKTKEGVTKKFPAISNTIILVRFRSHELAVG